MTAITTAITAQTATITAIYASSARYDVEIVSSLIAKGSTMRKLERDYFAAPCTMVAKRVCDFADFVYSGYDGAMTISETKLAKWSTDQAAALVARYAAKVEIKASGMTDVVVSAMAADGSFTVTGTKAGQAIEIRQQMVIHTNAKGTRFAQFPALVYVAGRKSTEKALKAL